MMETRPQPSYFKIVQTNEGADAKSKPTLALVPSAWERNGILFWPQNISNTELLKMLKNVSSVPQSGWSEMPTKVKRTAIHTVKNGSKILKDMLALTDTSNTENEEGEELKSRHLRHASTTYTQKSHYTQMMVCI